MDGMKRLMREPMFLVGFAIRLILLVLVVPSAVEHWFTPFLAHSLGTFSLDPWSTWLASGGDRLAFPYGYAMWLLFLPLTVLAKILGVPMAAGLGATLLLVDVAMLRVLRRLAGASDRTLLALYWLSPIVLFATYWQGYNDLVPIVLLMLGLEALRELAPRRAGVWVALAVSAKLSMILAAPFLLVYLFNNKRLRVLFLPFAIALGLSLLAAQAPYLLSHGGREMLFGNPEVAKVYEISLSVGAGLRVYILPLVYLLTLFAAWRLRRMNFDMLLSLLGMAFFLVLLLTPAAPGWFVWVLPFLVLYQAKSDRTATAIVSLLSVLFIGLSVVLGPLPSLLGTTDWPAGARISESLALSAHALSLWQTMLLGTGLILAARMLREGLQGDPYFLLSRRPFTLGIAGDSGSGKDTLSDAITGLFGTHSVVQVSGDTYHLWDRQKPIWQAMTHLNPRANDLARLTRDVQALVRGREVHSPHYDHTSGKMSKPAWLKSNDFIIVSGLHAYYPPLLHELYGLTIYLDMDESVRRQLKIHRDVDVRGHRLEQVLSTIERRAPDSIRFIRPQAARADLVLSLQPANAEALARGEMPSRFRLRVQARQGMYYEDLVRVLIGLCGLHVDRLQESADSSIEMTVEGEVHMDDIALAARQLLPELRELLDVQPQWKDGMLGIMQLIVLCHVAQALRKRLI